MNKIHSSVWSKLQKSKPINEVGLDSWLKGYFWSRGDNSDATSTRNLHVLKIRDLAPFSGGDIVNKNILDSGRQKSSFY